MKICYKWIMKNFIVRNKNLILLWVLCGVGLCIFCGHYSNTLLDIGREIYYPERILRGDVLYKDLFNIYGPFSYLWNAVLYKIISPNILTLYLSGCVCAFGIVSGIYLIAKKFLSEGLSFALGAFAVMTGVCATHLFNFTLPYSFAMLYGTVAFIYSLLFLVKFKETNSPNWLYLSSLLCGICIANKYDFFLYGILVLAVALKTKNKRVILNSLTCLMLVPVVLFIVLVLQGLRLNDIITAATDIKHVISSKSLTYFYKVQGIYFSPTVILLWLINLLRTGIGFAGLMLGAKLTEKNKFFGWATIGFFTIVTLVLTSPPVFMFIAPLAVILFIIGKHKSKIDSKTLILTIGTLSVCAKSFWVMLPLNYGVYVLPTILTAGLVLLFCLIDKNYEKVFAIGLIAVGLNFLGNALGERVKLNTPIVTEKGVIYTHKNNAEVTNGLTKILRENEVKTAYIYPEGLTVNFLSNVDGDGYFNSLLPLYSESFGEKAFIDAIEKHKPEVIVLSNQNMKEYGVEYICSNYAFEFCNYLSKNYTMTYNLDKGFRVVVFERK